MVHAERSNGADWLRESWPQLSLWNEEEQCGRNGLCSAGTWPQETLFPQRPTYQALVPNNLRNLSYLIDKFRKHFKCSEYLLNKPLDKITLDEEIEFFSHV